MIKKILAAGIFCSVAVATAQAQEGTLVHITKSNAQGFAVSSSDGFGDGQNVSLHEANPSDVNQQWIEIARGPSLVSYRKNDSEWCLDGGNGGGNRQNVDLWRCDSENENQIWLKESQGDGSVRLKKANTPFYALDGGNDGKQGQNVQIYSTDNESANLNWIIKPSTDLVPSIPHPDPVPDIAFLAGATFVSTDTPESGVRGVTSILDFTYDTVSWNLDGITQEGTYLTTPDGGYIATFPDQEIIFAKDGIDVLWNSVVHSRSAYSVFDSQESLQAFFDGDTYTSVEQFNAGETSTGEPALVNWSIRFIDGNAHWAVQDTIQVLNYTFLGDSSFTLESPNNETTGVVLDNDQIVINSVVYQKDARVMFDSQETLVAFLDGTSYQSSSLLPIGEGPDGTVAVGHWSVRFLSDTFIWSTEDVIVPGMMVSYVSENIFNLVTYGNTTFTVELEDDEFVLNDVRYVKIEQ